MIQKINITIYSPKSNSKFQAVLLSKFGRVLYLFQGLTEFILF